MKKIFLIFSLVFFVGIISAQTTVRSDKVVNYEYTDTLTKDDVVNVDYYVPSFPATIKVQAQCDSLATSASGYSKVNVLVYGSLDYSNWYLLGDTIELAGIGADSDTLTYSDNYWNHYRVKTWALDTVQNSTFDLQILFDLN